MVDEQGQGKGSEQKQDSVPLKDFLPIKRKAAKVDKLEGRIQELEAELARRQEAISPFPLKDEELDEEEDVVRKHLLAEAEKIDAKRKEIEKGRKDLADEKKAITIDKLVSQYGFSDLEKEELIEADDPEKVAFRLKLEKTQAELSKMKEEKGKEEERRKETFEGGTPLSAGKSISQMTVAEFDAYVEQQRRKAEKRK